MDLDKCPFENLNLFLLFVDELRMGSRIITLDNLWNLLMYGK